MRIPFTLLTLILLSGYLLPAQDLMLDAAFSRSLADQATAQVALRWQASPTLRLGLEAQVGLARDRFIAARPYQQGSAWSLSLPVSWQFLQRGPLRADAYLRLGYRLNQAQTPVSEAYGDRSHALLAAAGVVTSYAVTPRLWLQTGVLLPFTYEIAPLPLMEQAQAAQILAGVSYRLGDRAILSLQSPFGSSYGGDGDTAKFLWTLQAGLRFALGDFQASHLLLDPAY